MDAVRAAIAVGPLAAYFLLLGIFNLRRRPTVTTGGRDVIALAVGLSGVAIVGPLELFMPTAAAAVFGAYVWPLLAALYGMSVTLFVLYARPRIVVYNAAEAELRSVLGRLLNSLDADARWAGEMVHLPKLGMQFYIEPNPTMRNVSLIGTSETQNLGSWRTLARQLAKVANQLGPARNTRGGSLILLGLASLVASIWHLVRDTAIVTESLADLLRL